MIDWEALSHFHVLKRIEQLLGKWFRVDMVYLDYRGVVKNYDPKDRQREFRNPLFAKLLAQESSRKEVLGYFKKVMDQLLEKNENTLVVPGICEFEKGYFHSIELDREKFGAVGVYAYFEKNPSEKERKNLEKKLDTWNIDGPLFFEAISKQGFLKEKDQKYIYELVQLAVEEIKTYHQEITTREERIRMLQKQFGNRYRYDAMIGRSKAMQQIYDLLDKIKTSEASVLIEGENGTGKELIAKSVYCNSIRKDGPFLTVNCSAFNENLLESELFGHVKGSFTGATRDKKGFFEAAHRGTLFLDEIGDMSLAMQVKLLRVLQDGTLMPVGGTEPRKVDVRIIAATNKDLEKMIEEGTFREDLYYRINVIHIEVPPLRERREDISLLIEYFIERACKKRTLPSKQLSKRAIQKVMDYSWHGNIRELENEVERLMVLSGEEKVIGLELLSPKIQEHQSQPKVQVAGASFSGNLKEAIKELEKTMIWEGLKRTRFNKSRLAKELGISRAGLISKVNMYDLDKRLKKSKKGVA